MFEVEELVTLLRNLNAVDIVVIRIPAVYEFADYMVIVSAKSIRHIKAMAADIKWIVSLQYKIYFFHFFPTHFTHNNLSCIHLKNPYSFINECSNNKTIVFCI